MSCSKFGQQVDGIYRVETARHFYQARLLGGVQRRPGGQEERLRLRRRPRRRLPRLRRLPRRPRRRTRLFRRRFPTRRAAPALPRARAAPALPRARAGPALPRGPAGPPRAPAGRRAPRRRRRARTGTGGTAAPAPNTSIAFRFEPAQGFCGDRVHVKADTQNLADGTAVTITLRPQQGSSPHLAAINATVSGNKIDQEFEIKNVDLGTGASSLEQVQVEATSTNAATVTCATPLQVKGRKTAGSQHFDEHRTWNGFSGHARFDESVANYRAIAALNADIMQCWGATYINMARAGITGDAGNCLSGMRWGRNTSATGGMTPNQYYDGSAWQNLPTGFTPNAAEYFSVAFYKRENSSSGWDRFVAFFRSGYTSPSGATYPDEFPDYDFNASAYTTVRNNWVTWVHQYWTEKWALRRHGCNSEADVHCCKYDVDVSVTFHAVTRYDNDVILVGPGDYRSNASTFFMGDSRQGLAPHEIGHLMDNPDEYQYGAIDPSINTDGAVNGIDANSIMGQNLTTVKKRHYHAFALMLQRCINAAYSNNDAFDTVAR